MDEELLKVGRAEMMEDLGTCTEGRMMWVDENIVDEWEKEADERWWPLRVQWS